MTNDSEYVHKNALLKAGKQTRGGFKNTTLKPVAQVLLMATFLPLNAAAALIFHSDRDGFFNHLASLSLTPAVLDFDNEAAGALTANGGTVGGIAFSYDFGRESENPYYLHRQLQRSQF